jgi:hypothetical protein
MLEEDIRSLINSLLKSYKGQGTLIADKAEWRDLSGGLSGAWVGVTKIPGINLILVLKAAAKDMIDEEVEGRRNLAERLPDASRRLDQLKEIGLDGASNEVEVRAESDMKSKYKAMASVYEGPTTYEEIASCADFKGVFEDYCTDRRCGRSANCARAWASIQLCK